MLSHVRQLNQSFRCYAELLIDLLIAVNTNYCNFVFYEALLNLVLISEPVFVASPSVYPFVRYQDSFNLYGPDLKMLG